jgi:hypothetical protein
MQSHSLDYLIAQRNAANDNAPPLYGAKPVGLNEKSVRDYLKLVRSHAATLKDNDSAAASFCGAAGLVIIRGKSATITDSGLQAIA